MFSIGKRTRNLFDPDKPFKLSRSKIELFIECPRCFYIDRRLGIGRPSIPGYTLNSAVDELLKKEFDLYRLKQEPYPIMTEYGVSAVPFAHEMMDVWRQNFKGVQYTLPNSNLMLHGAVDDIWVTPAGELIVVDYKATSTSSEITLDSEYRQAYKRQMEIYQWLLRRNGFAVLDRGYFLYANGLKTPERFDSTLTFTLQLLPYDGDDTWVESAVRDCLATLHADTPPAPNENCEYCAYTYHCGSVEV